MKNNIKFVLEKLFPKFSKTYRLKRDLRKINNHHKIILENGFVFFGDELQIKSRIGTGEIEAFYEFFNNTDVFVDIGANVGYISLLASEKIKKIISVEPNLDNYQLLLKNIKENKIQNIEPVFGAISYSCGIMSLYGGGEGASLETNWGGMYETYSRLVYTSTLDELLYKKFENEKLFIKIDVEGHEFQVLEGAKKMLDLENSPIWLVEIGFTENFDGKINPSFKNIFDEFLKRNYKCLAVAEELKEIIESDIDRWLANNKRDSNYINYIFFK